MIVILSYAGDQLTNAVMDWLYVYKCKYKRINLEEEDFRKLELSITTNELDMQLELSDGELLKLKEVSIFFFRGGLFRLDLKNYRQTDLPVNLVDTHLLQEFNSLVNFFYKQIARKCLGNPLLHPLNKLEQLEIASEVGLNIPSSVINSSKRKLQKGLLKTTPVFITKSIQENVLYQKNSEIHYDLKVQELGMNKVTDFFFPSLFQEGIQKTTEIRSFYLDGSFYSIAMLLCASDQHIVDYRTAANSIRYALYKLPLKVEIPLHELMKRMGLTSGSIDLILAGDGDYYFLEVNPTGQIGWVSDYGNYCLEEKIAKYLLKKENHYVQKHATSPAG